MPGEDAPCALLLSLTSIGPGSCVAEAMFECGVEVPTRIKFYEMFGVFCSIADRGGVCFCAVRLSDDVVERPGSWGSIFKFG